MLEKFSDLLGNILSNVTVNDAKDEIVFVLENGERYKLYHSQDCCESVTVEDICGDLSDLIGLPILLAEEVTSNGNPKEEYHESSTWTFYKLSTNLGSVTIRWYGQSNGYYSERVDFAKV